MKKIKKALISVSNKKNLNFLLNVLKKNKIQIISSGGTYKEIKKLGFNCIEISKYTNSKEILEGRVKTLHPKIHAGILSVRNNKKHIKDLNNHNYEEIDLVIVNFYPFEKTSEIDFFRQQIKVLLSVLSQENVRAGYRELTTGSLS